MPEGPVFHDLDATLTELIQRELPSSMVPQISVSFATPGSDFPGATVLPAINLFLYDIVENKDLRSRQPIEARAVTGTAEIHGKTVEVAPGTVVRALAPVRVDCHYLVTTWAKPVGQPEQVEHRLLGYVLRALLRHREIPTAMLQGVLRRQPFPIRAAAIQGDVHRPRGDFWQALGGKPRPCFDYRVTVCVELGDIDLLGPVAWGSSIGGAS
ncbi:MAG: DUF4255 domain-containing protein [Byssovorax sp.]